MSARRGRDFLSSKSVETIPSWARRLAKAITPRHGEGRTRGKFVQGASALTDAVNPKKGVSRVVDTGSVAAGGRSIGDRTEPPSLGGKAKVFPGRRSYLSQSLLDDKDKPVEEDMVCEGRGYWS